MLEAVSGAQTKTFKFRFNTPVNFDGPNDYMYIYLNSNSGANEPFKSIN